MGRVLGRGLDGEEDVGMIATDLDSCLGGADEMEAEAVPSVGGDVRVEGGHQLGPRESGELLAELLSRVRS